MTEIFSFFVIIFLIIAGVFFLKSGFFIVEEATKAIIERFGRFQRAVGPGLHWKLPGGIETVRGRLSLRVQQSVVKVDTITRDNVSIDVVVSVQFHVIPGTERAAFYRLTDVTEQLKSLVFNTVRSQVPTQDLGDVFAHKNALENTVMTELKVRFGDYGYMIDAAPITDIAIATKVREAMNEINASKRMQEAAVFQGDANRIKIVKAAEAEKEAKKLQGEGIAAERIAIAEGIRQAIETVLQSGQGTSTDEAMRTLLMTQYFDTLKAIGIASRSTIFLPHSPGGIADISAQIAQAVMVGNQAPTGAPRDPEKRAAAE